MHPRRATGVSGALIGIFARFAEVIIQRLNQAPQKNFLAFLDLLGAALLPPQPARVPLTFSLAAGSAVDGLVPAGTQVAAPPAEGEKEPVIFETERELTVTAAQLTALFVRDPEQDTYADNSEILAAPSATAARVFQGNRRIEHILYIGDSQLLGFPGIERLRLSFTIEPPQSLLLAPRCSHTAMGGVGRHPMAGYNATSCARSDQQSAAIRHHRRSALSPQCQAVLCIRWRTVGCAVGC